MTDTPTEAQEAVAVVERFVPAVAGGADWTAAMVPNSKGEWVRHRDSASRIAQLEAALKRARVYVEMIVTDQFADTGTDKEDLARIDAALAGGVERR